MGNLEISSLIYKGHTIESSGEQLSLTTMWRASRSDPQKAPSKWRSLPSAKAFIEFVELTIGKSDSELFRTVNGGKNPGTWAHWQIGLAYAKYLSPDFHMWCNTVVRDHMEGKLAPAATAPVDNAMIGSIVAAIIPPMLEAMISERLARENLLVRRGVTAKHVWDQSHLPGKIRGATVWLGNRLAEMSCCIDGGMKADNGNSAVRLFDPDKAGICMKNGLAHQARIWAQERLGQGRLKLVA